MKRVASLLTALLLAVLVAGCSLLPSKTVILKDYLAGEQYDALNQAVEAGSDLPNELFFTIPANGYADTIEDLDLTSLTWQRLSFLEIAERAEEEAPVEGGEIVFSFRWPDGRLYSYTFQTTEYFEDETGGLHQLRDAAQMGSILSSIVEYLDEQDEIAAKAEADAQAAIAFDGSTFQWDATGDGVPENFQVTFYDNGDEAPSVLEIVCTDEWYDGVWIDGGYSIQGLWQRWDETGPYLEVSYTYGDSYYHDNVGTCQIRLVDGILTATYL